MHYFLALKMFLNTYLSALKTIIQDCHGRHCFYDGNGTGQDARVMAATGTDCRFLSVNIYCLLLAQKRSHRLKGHAEINIFAITDASLNAATVIGERFHASFSIGNKDIVLLTASRCRSGKALAVFKAFHRVDAKHGRAQSCVQFAESRFANADGTTFHHTRYNAADGITLGLDFGNKPRHFGGLLRVWATHGIFLYFRKVVIAIMAIKGNISDLRSISYDCYTQLPQGEFGQSTADNTSYGFASRGTPAATMVPYAILLIIGIVGMTRAEDFAQIIIIGRMLVFVADEKADGATG